MPNHKLTLLGHPAFKAAQRYLQFNPPEPERETLRVAFAHGVIAISGRMDVKKSSPVEFAREQYGVDLGSPDLVRRFEAMIRSDNVKKAENWKVDNCAEAHLWMTLTGLHASYALQGQAPRHRHPHPKQLHLWVYEIDRKNRPKEDSPCLNLPAVGASGVPHRQRDGLAEPRGQTPPATPCRPFRRLPGSPPRNRPGITSRSHTG